MSSALGRRLSLVRWVFGWVMGGEDAGQIWVRKYLCLLDKVEEARSGENKRKRGSNYRSFTCALPPPVLITTLQSRRQMNILY